MNKKLLFALVDHVLKERILLMKKISKKIGAVIMSVSMAFTFAPSVAYAEVEDNEVETVPVYGLYNPNSGEHFFTISESEAQGLLKIGWKEGDVKWKAPTEGEAVYRLYNPNVITPSISVIN